MGMVLMLLLMTTTEMAHPVLPDPDRSAMQKALAERVSTLIEEQLSDRRIRFELTPRWIPRQLLRMDPERLERVELAGPPDRFATVDVVTNRRAEQVSFQVQFALELEQQLPVARRRIEAGETLSSDDLSVTWLSVARPENRLAESPDELVGQSIRSVHKPGQPFRRSELMLDPVVEAGDPVRMLYRRGSLEVVLDGEARESGAVGDVIGFYSQETRRRYRAVIRDPQTLVWERTQ